MGTLDTEIFAVGKWNGLSFSGDDLNLIAKTFSELGDNMRVPLKFGHNDEQQMTDGKPALGWVEKVWVAGDKLMARFTDVPKLVVDAISKKLYRNVSVELDMDVQYKAKQYPFVLTGVALLGADIPAVNTLKDLTHYMGRGAAFSVGRRAVFSAIAGQSTKKGSTMELEQLTKQVTELSTQVANFSAENAKLVADNARLSTEVEKFKADATARTTAETKARLDAKRNTVTQVLEDGVKSEAITPAQREQFKKLARIDDDAALDALNVDDVKALTTGGKKQFSREQGKQGKQEGGDMPVGMRIIEECNKIISAGEAKNLFAAQSILFTRNPQLAREYADFNEEK